MQALVLAPGAAAPTAAAGDKQAALSALIRRSPTATGAPFLNIVSGPASPTIRVCPMPVRPPALHAVQGCQHHDPCGVGSLGSLPAFCYRARSGAPGSIALQHALRYRIALLPASAEGGRKAFAERREPATAHVGLRPCGRLVGRPVEGARARSAPGGHAARGASGYRGCRRLLVEVVRQRRIEDDRRRVRRHEPITESCPHPHGSSPFCFCWWLAGASTLFAYSLYRRCGRRPVVPLTALV
jgi:hypothetical protein